jgi:hypothetical protein
MRINGIAVGFVAFMVMSGVGTRTAYADFCVRADNGISYQFQVGTANPAAGTPIVVAGTRVVATFRTPVFGSLITIGPKTLIGISEPVNFGSGSFTHPMGTTIITFPGTPMAFNTYDTTFHGNGPPHNVMGSVTIVSCPVAGEALTSDAKDPNAK